MSTSPTGSKEFTNDSPDKIEGGSIKYDGGKSPVYRGAISYFPRAISAVASVSNFGASKYAWKGWEGVDDGVNRYSDALVRHLIYEGEGETLDPDSGLLHAAHTAWNALARLELMLREEQAMAEWAKSDEANDIVDQINSSPYLKGNPNVEPELPFTR